MKSIVIIKILFVLLFVTLLTAITYASIQQSLWPVLPELWAHIWFKVTLLDFYIGITIFSIWVIYREKTLLIALLWIVSFICLGNLATLVYVLSALRGVNTIPQLIDSDILVSSKKGKL